MSVVQVICMPIDGDSKHLFVNGLDLKELCDHCCHGLNG